ncbi:biotin transporter BioY [Azospirillum sp. ST 5-10]|uniref:biotin transporter BioY n=1 Tax=unclassified Azospirillum TaxID=2630922 RepID=UPI003F4A36EC
MTLDTRDMVLCALFAAVVAALGLVPPIPLGFLPVPITAQTLGVMLAGAVIGPRRAAIAMALFILLLAAGLPLLAGGRGGVGAVFGPTGGFLLAWPAGAFVVGWLAERLGAGARPLPLFLCCAVGGIAVVYAGGIAWLALVTGVPWEKAATGTLAFLPGDLIKAGAATAVAATLRRVRPLESARR